MGITPNSEQVFVAWLKGIEELDGAVATTLPWLDSWSDKKYFVTTNQIPGGQPPPYFPQESPVMSVDVWAANAGSTRPEWNKAFSGAHAIRKACLNRNIYPNSGQVIQRELVIPGDIGYNRARVLDLSCDTHPQKVSDPADFAHVSFIVSINWIELES